MSNGSSKDARPEDGADGIGLEPTGVGPDPSENADALRTIPTGHTDRDPYLGQVLAGRYRILDLLGEGGMGTVYLAEHVLIEKKVAIKILSEEMAKKEELVTRFLQEAKAASRIGHENIVDVTDFGKTDSGSVFIAMEHLEGVSLATEIRNRGALPFARIQPIMTQMCRALGAAHGKGIIHRDMKPDNVFLVDREGRSDVVKILDFGIAKMTSLDDSEARLTHTGMIFGTPEYMSPEQARGDPPDHRVDVYALGCILYEMLTGAVPFSGGTFMGLLTRHMFEPPEPPRQRAPQQQISAQVEEVVLRALAKDREERFASMRDFSLAIGACEGGDLASAWGDEGSAKYRPLPPHEPVSNAPPSRPPRSRAALWWGLVLGAAIPLAWIASGPRKVAAPAPTSVATAPVQPAAPAPEPPPPAPPSTPATFRISIASTPAGAEVFRGAERIGVTPAELDFPAGSERVTLRISKQGFADTPLDVEATRDRDYTVALAAVVEAAHAHDRPGNLRSHKSPTPDKKSNNDSGSIDRQKSNGSDIVDPFR